MNYSDLNTEQQMIAEIKKYVNNKALDVQSDWNESDSSVGDYIKNKPTLGTAAALDVASSGDASSSQVVKGDDSRLTDSRNAADVYSWAKAPSKPSYTASEVGAIATTAKGVANGVATLDNNGFIPSSQLPSYVDDAIEGYYYNSKFYKESTHTTEIIGETGKIYIDLSTNKTYRWSGSIYVEINKSQLIQASSTNGNIKIDGTEITVYTHPGSGTNPHGTTKNDVGLGNVDNTSDANKPISTATQTALNNKVDKETGKGLSTNDYTTEEKTKLAGIEAQANKTVVDSSMSTTSTNPLQNKVITKELEGAKTTNGNPITVTDAAPVNAVDVSVDIEPVQDLHGYDHPWVGGAGKNKLPLTVAEIKALNTGGTWSGNTYTLDNTTFEVNEDDNGYVTEIKANGTPTNNILYFRVAQNISVASPLIFSTGYTDTWEINGHVMEMAVDNTSYKPFDVSGVEIPTGTYELHIAVAAGRAINNNYKPMLRPTTVSDYSYAPYTNICPISGRTEEIITQKDNPTNPTVTKTYTIQFGQTVYGGTLDVTRGKMVVDRGYIASYNGETLPSTWISDRDVYVEGTTPTIGAEVCYELATPITIPLTPQQIKLLENTNTVYTDYEGDTIHIEYQPNNAIGEAVRAVEESYDPEFAALEEKSNNAMQKGIDYVTAGQRPGSTLGTKATAEGSSNVASGTHSHAEGSNNVASGNYSHAEGYGTKASTNASHAEGNKTQASSNYSHAEGSVTTASGFSSHAEGSGTSSSGDSSHAEGGNTTASGNYSHAEGYTTMASGEGSHAEGNDTTASGECSHAEGYETSATNYASHSCGHYNAAMTTGGSANNTTGTAFVIGNGTSSSALTNAFSVQYNGVVKAASTITASTTADYAEFFEWSDENLDDEDRVGLFVTNSEDDPTKIRIASNEDDYILGIVSGDPFVLGNGDCDVWNGMVMRDDFGRVIYEPAQKYEFNPETGEEEPVYDDEGNPVYEGVKPVYNPDYDPSIPYISRFDRKEWAPIGMLGVLHVYDDGTCEVNGYCTVGEDGKATKIDKYDRSVNCYKVIARIKDNIIKVIFR